MDTPRIDNRDWSALTFGERIRQIEAKALRKLKTPARAKKLRPFLEDILDVA